MSRVRFGDLKVRPKLVVLHNVFFLVLTCAVYFSLIPLVEERVARARLREMNLVAHLAASERNLDALPGIEVYEYRRGSAAALGVSPEIRARLDAHPEFVQLGPGDPSTVFAKDSTPGQYRRLRLPDEFYADVVRRAQGTLLVVLAIIYVLAVLALELIIMPRYVYSPIQAYLRADEASEHGSRQEEFIPNADIPGDEIGQIMRSRNATVSRLRMHEDELEEALALLQDLNQDLTRKNYLLETAKRSIADQDRLVSLGMLSASVAHEINTPLAVLHGSIEKLIETVREPAAQQRLHRMLRVTERLRGISASLLDFARAPSQVFKEVRLRETIEEAWELVAIDEKALRVAFHNEVPAGEMVTGSADRLVQLFVNLLRNALQAAPAGGRIAVRLGHAREDGKDWQLISVEDNGPGIPPHALPNIFEAFVTTRLDSRGTGLGLAVSEGIVTEHGGAISAANMPEGGACLQVRLPAGSRASVRTPALSGQAAV